jgi:O-acetyl-ADP-ribose deacetylase (regulator of RNase III)
MKKLKVLAIEQAHPECPFYALFDDLRYDCVFKNLVEDERNEETKKFENPMVGVFNDIMPKKQNFIDLDKWSANCHGKYDNCVFLHSMYDWNAEGEISVSSAAEDYDPYRKDDNIVPMHKPSIENVKISVHLVPSPYRVKADMLVYPNNNLLEILDANLQQITQYKLQKQLDNIRDSGVAIKMGHCYNTDSSNIESLPFKNVVHATVAGAGGLPEEKYISSATQRALILAESLKSKSVAIMPMDLGTLNVYQGALAQMSSVLEYFEENTNSEIQRVYFVVTTEEVLDTYEEYYRRIFKKENPAKKK